MKVSWQVTRLHFLPAGSQGRRGEALYKGAVGLVGGLRRVLV